MSNHASTDAQKNITRSRGTDSLGRAAFGERMTASEFLEKSYPSRPKQIGNFAREGDLVTVIADSSVNVNEFLIPLALSLSCGENFLGLTVNDPYKVVWVSASSAPERFLKCFKAHLQGQEIEPPKTLAFVALSKLEANNLNEFDAAVFSHCVGDKWDVLLVNGNSAGVLLVGEKTDLSPKFAKWAYQQQSLGKTVIVTLHTGSPEWKRHVGSKVMAADLSIHLLSQIHNVDDGSTTLRITLDSAHRVKNGPLKVDAVVTTDEHGGALLTHQKIKTSDGDERIARAKKLHGKGKSKTEIGEKLGVHRSTVSRWLNQ